jgi:glycine cleavage system H protein
MQVDKYNINENYLYIKEHEWTSIEEDEAIKIGITDYAQKALREITYFYAGQSDVEVKQMETTCKLESTKCVVEIMSPLSGIVLRFNRGLRDDPGIINSDPYGEGWIAVIRPTRLEEELGELLKPEQYADHLKELTKVNETLLIHRWKKGTEEKTE